MTLKERRKGRANLRYWFSLSTPDERERGMRWYNEAREYASMLSNLFNKDKVLCAGVISALSPNNKWGRNKIDAFAVLKAVVDDTPSNKVKVCTYNANKEKAFAIARGEIAILKRSPKTYAFALSIGGLDNDDVTIDKWHLRAVRTRSLSPRSCKTTITPKQYANLEADCQKVAKELNIKPSELQAIVWVTIRNKWTA